MLIHIGLHKCASSFLQNEVFVKDPRLLCLTGSKKSPLTSSLIGADSTYFDKSRCLALFEKKLLNPASKNDQIPVLSAERLSGIPYFGSFDRATVSKRIKQTFPQTKIFIVIRNQQDLIRSVYGQYIKIGGTLKIDKFLRSRWKGPEFSSFNLEQFDFYKLYQHYAQYFAHSQLLVLPFEQLQNDPKSFLSRIYDFIGIPIDPEIINFNHKLNKTPSFSYLNILRMANKIFLSRRTMFNHSPLLIHKDLHTEFLKVLQKIINYDHAIPEISSVINEYIGDYFQSSNKQLDETLNLNLKTLGYDL